MKSFIVTIDQKRIKAKTGQTVLELAQKNNIDIPALCYHPDLKTRGSCRLCLIEIKGKKGLHTSCSIRVEPNMVVITDSPEIRRARRVNLELIFAQHKEECVDCGLNLNCNLLKLAKEYEVDIHRLVDRKTKYRSIQFGPSIFFDRSKCIDCGNCVEVCEKQGIGFLETKEGGHNFQIIPSAKKNIDCIYCGQCIVHCLVEALRTVNDLEKAEKLLNQKNKIVVFQFAPSIRTSIGEEFGMKHSSVVTGKLIAAIRKLGVAEVFDVSVGADFTTIEEANELIEKLEMDDLPLFTSCCPAWVKYVEFYEPEFMKNLTTVRSPHIILGGLIKNYWAKKKNIDAKNISVVSVMPCVSKKYEIERKEMNIDGLRPVDHVLTTRELAHFLKKKKIDLTTIKEEKPSLMFGSATGGGIIYGASGGVMESALRTVHHKLTKRKLPKIEFKEVRGASGFKKASVKIGKRTLKIAVVNGINNAKKILEELKENPSKYDYVEIMACPGGCIGGGGQPIPNNAEIRIKRAKGLYSIDQKKEIRLSDQNLIVKKIYKEFLKKNNVYKLLHTKYYSKKKEVK
ncbi:MAG: [FeFe] hydrogenase, group A [Patescibacteria group bacterium]